MLGQRDFDFIRIIGSGSFGKVFLAKNLRTNKYVAIKRMEKAVLKANRQIDNVHNEAKILKKASSCPFIVKFICFVETDLDVFIAMEYVKGGELFYYLRKYGRFSPETTLFFAAEILMALKFLHSKNILYRDLKPENILITSDGHIKLADFGFATISGENVYLLCGTPEYMAPEKLLGDGDTKETDYWSYGCLIYEMLCGTPPFYDNTTDDIYRKILGDEVFYPDDMPGEANDLIQCLLKKDREFRIGAKGIGEIFSHPFFKNVIWQDVIDLKTKTDFAPTLFQFQAEDSLVKNTSKSEPRSAHKYKRIFKLKSRK